MIHAMKRLAVPALVGAFGAAVSPSHAQTVASTVNTYNVPTTRVNDGSAYLFGNWSGERARLEDEGVAFQFGLTDEAAHNFTGGTRELTRNTSQVLLGSSLDLDKLFGWTGASFRVAITERSGHDLGNDAQIGNNQLIQEVYGLGQTWRTTQFWLQQNWLDGKVSVLAGRTQANSEFGHRECDFQNLTFCATQSTNMLRYWTGWPASVWAVRVKVATSADTYVMTGAYQDNPTYSDNRYATHHGLSLDNPGGTLGALIPLEFGWTPHVAGLPGRYQVGGWYDNGGAGDLATNREGLPLATAGGTARHRSAEYGGYVALKQQVSGDAGGRGTTLSLNYTQADHATAQTDRQVSLTVQYQGIGDRLADSVGMAVGATHASNYYAKFARAYNDAHPNDTALDVGGGYEKVVEAYYSWVPVPSIVVRPNLQYIADPGGSDGRHNAFVAGLKTMLTF